MHMHILMNKAWQITYMFVAIREKTFDQMISEICSLIFIFMLHMFLTNEQVFSCVYFVAVKAKTNMLISSVEWSSAHTTAKTGNL